MSQANIDVVRAIHEAFNAGRSAAEFIAEDLEYVNPPYAVEAGTRRGRRTLLGVREVYADFRMVPERYIDTGSDDVVVIGAACGTGASGAEMHWRMGYVWTVKDGRATRLRWFNDPDEALDAAGLSR